MTAQLEFPTPMQRSKFSTAATSTMAAAATASSHPSSTSSSTTTSTTTILPSAIVSSLPLSAALELELSPSNMTTPVRSHSVEGMLSLEDHDTPNTWICGASAPRSPAILATPNSLWLRRSTAADPVPSTSSSSSMSSSVSSSPLSSSASPRPSSPPGTLSARSDASPSPRSRTRSTSPPSPTDCWYGVEDSEHVHRVLDEYARTLRLREVRERGSRAPLEYVACVKRVPFGSHFHCAIATNASTNASAASIDPASATFCTLDTLKISLREPNPLGSVLSFNRTVHVHTCWDALDGYPVSIVAVSPRRFRHAHRLIQAARMRDENRRERFAVRAKRAMRTACGARAGFAPPLVDNTATHATYFFCRPSYQAEREGPFVYSSATHALKMDQLCYQGLDQPCVMRGVHEWRRSVSIPNAVGNEVERENECSGRSTASSAEHADGADGAEQEQEDREHRPSFTLHIVHDDRDDTDDADDGDADEDDQEEEGEAALDVDQAIETDAFATDDDTVDSQDVITFVECIDGFYDDVDGVDEEEQQDEEEDDEESEMDDNDDSDDDDEDDDEIIEEYPYDPSCCIDMEECGATIELNPDEECDDDDDDDDGADDDDFDDDDDNDEDEDDAESDSDDDDNDEDEDDDHVDHADDCTITVDGEFAAHNLPSSSPSARLSLRTSERALNQQSSCLHGWP